jgi:hypothetical protein
MDTVVMITEFPHDAGQVQRWLTGYAISAVSVSQAQGVILHDAELTEEQIVEIKRLLEEKMDEPVVDSTAESRRAVQATLSKAMQKGATLAEMQAALAALAAHLGYEVET